MRTSTDRIILLSFGPESRILSISTDGSDVKVLVDGLAKPDGVAIDPMNGHLFYTFMGIVRQGEDFFEVDGYIERANLDGTERKVIVRVGQLYTPSRSRSTGRAAGCTRATARACAPRLRRHRFGPDRPRPDRDDRRHRQDRRRHCVGVGVDRAGGFDLWTQKGQPNGNEGRILRAPLGVVPDDPAARTDTKPCSSAAEPIDLEWDGERRCSTGRHRVIHRGNTLNRATPEAARPSIPRSSCPASRKGSASLDRKGRRVFVGDLGGHLRVVDLDRPGEGRVSSRGFLRKAATGIASCEAETV